MNITSTDIFSKRTALPFLDNKNFICQMCSKSYKSKYKLTRHMKYECGQEPQFQCPYCIHRSCHKFNLKKHILYVHQKSE